MLGEIKPCRASRIEPGSASAHCGSHVLEAEGCALNSLEGAIQELQELPGVGKLASSSLSGNKYFSFRNAFSGEMAQTTPQN
jgi:hypothetical protein